MSRKEIDRLNSAMNSFYFSRLELWIPSSEYRDAILWLIFDSWAGSKQTVQCLDYSLNFHKGIVRCVTEFYAQNRIYHLDLIRIWN